MARGLAARIVPVLLGRSMARAAQFAAFLLIGRMLGPAEFGWYGLVTASVVLAAQLGSIGLRQASAVTVGQNEAPAARVTGSLLALWPVLAVLSALAVLAVLRLSVPAEASPAPMIVLAMTGAMAVILMQAVLLGLGRTALFGLSDSLMPLVLLLGVGLLWLGGGTGFGPVLAALALSHVVAGLAAIALATREAGLARPEPALFAPMVRSGLAFAVNVFLVMLSTRLSLYLVEWRISSEAVGQFFVGQRLSDILGEVALAAGLVLFSDTVRASDRGAAMRSNARIAAAVLWGFAILSLPVAFAAGPLVAISFGADYGEAAGVLAIAALAIGPVAATKLIYPVLAAQGKPLWGTPAILASIAVNAALSLMLMPRYGLGGAAAALVASQVVLLFGYSIVLKRRFAVPFRDTLVPAFHGVRA